jgi:hypothetical protein
VKINVKKLIRDADYEPVSPELDQKMVELFSASLNAEPELLRRRRRRYAGIVIFAHVSVVAVLIVLSVFWQQKSGDDDSEKLAQLPGIAGETTRLDSDKHTSEFIFDQQNVVLKNLYAAVNRNGDLYFERIQ